MRDANQYWLLVGTANASEKVWGLKKIPFPCGYSLPKISFNKNNQLLMLPNKIDKFWLMGGLAFEIAKSGKYISASDAKNYIAGFRPWIATFHNYLLDDLTEKKHTITTWDKGVSIFYGMWSENCNTLGSLYAFDKYKDTLNSKSILKYNSQTYFGQSFKDYIHQPEKVVNFMSQFMTLSQGDIYILGPLIAECVDKKKGNIDITFGKINLSLRSK